MTEIQQDAARPPFDVLPGVVYCPLMMFITFELLLMMIDLFIIMTVIFM